MRVILPLLLILAAPAYAGSSFSDAICFETQAMKQKLTRQMGATQRAMGLRSPDEVLEVWIDGEGEWTMVMTYASGRSCIVAMGEHWSEAALPQDPA
ncbi:hypothetical protein [Pseudoprimorskyibacter insulae]|uniref:Uncharacterized protein n=1 Tax=Pseudoprimorskyibacter insulae TaxID=1695997 RepID=A0A2R8AQA3_9RHOB|nr:hypothetical protein [Pseudoprimorskyibacter insulae]SPF78067.1 hypothetical protein PRI8871_00656 [Pseudoprimorskyibacter insulae]